MKTNLLKFKRVYKFIPTALTLGNTLCGFAAILNCLQAYRYADDFNQLISLMTISSWLIVGAMIFDMLDGWTARKLNASSSHGLQMDSLADMVTFGVAPGIMIAVMAQLGDIHGELLRFNFLNLQLVWIFCGIYVSCVALRLALYNVMAMEGDMDSTFHGLPSPGGAAAVCSLIFAFNYLNNNDVENAHILIKILPFYAAILGLLMVSPFPYEHIGKWLGKQENNKLKILVVIIFFSAFSYRPYLIAALAINIYILFGPVKGIVKYCIGKFRKS